jgi:hypothetical protein
LTWKWSAPFGDIVKRIGSKALPALLLMLALLMILHVSRNQVEGVAGGMSSAGETDHPSGITGDMVDDRLGKPTKVSQRPGHQEKEAKTPLAEPVAGQPGFVYHPVSRQIVDVRGIPAGFMVQQGMSEMFLIPKMGYVITSEAYRKAVWNNLGKAEPGVTLSVGSEAGLTWSLGNGDGVSVVSCHPMHWETQWDDGTRYIPDGEAKEEPESSLE